MFQDVNDKHVVQVAQTLHFTGIGAQDLAADFHRLWKYEDQASAHVTLPASAQKVCPLPAAYCTYHRASPICTARACFDAWLDMLLREMAAVRPEAALASLPSRCHHPPHHGH